MSGQPSKIELKSDYNITMQIAVQNISSTFHHVLGQQGRTIRRIEEKNSLVYSETFYSALYLEKR